MSYISLLNEAVMCLSCIIVTWACQFVYAQDIGDAIDNIISDNKDDRTSAEEKIKALGMQGRIVLKHALLNHDISRIRVRAAAILLDVLRRHSPDNDLACIVSDEPRVVEIGRKNLVNLGVIALPALEEYRKTSCPAVRRRDLDSIIEEIKKRSRMIGDLISKEESVKTEALKVLKEQGEPAICDLEMEVIAPRSKAVQDATITALASIFDCSEDEARVRAIINRTIIDIDFKDVPICEGMKYITKVTGITIVLDPRVPQSKKISCKAAHVPVSGGLALALRPFSLWCEIRGAELLVIPAK